MKTTLGLLFGLLTAPITASDVKFDMSKYVQVLKEPCGQSTNEDFSKYLNESPGWNGAGGGEFITHRHNPWFLGTKPVTWCIDHGGEENFSLSKEKAKALIEKAFDAYLPSLERMSKVKFSGFGIQSTYDYREICGLSNDGDTWWEACSYDGAQERSSIQLVNHNYQYSESCENADLEIVLGNVNNPKVQALIASVGVKSFGRTAGTAIKTQFNSETLETKGFIYIAADKGSHSYKGARNLKYKSETIWDYHDNLPKNAPYPPSEGAFGGHLNVDLKHVPFKSITTSPLLSLVTHELGHVFGVRHINVKGNLMHQDYPAQIIANGLDFLGDYERKAKIFERGLIGTWETAPNTEIIRRNDYLRGFEWDPAGTRFIDMMFDDGGAIPDFFNYNKEPDRYGDDGDYLQRVFVFSDKEVTFYEVDHKEKTKELYYKKKRSYKYQMNEMRNPHDILDSIYFRTLGKTNPTESNVYDPATNSWTMESAPSATFVKQVKLYIFRLFKFEGKIFMDPNDPQKFITFRLDYDYRQSRHTLVLNDPNAGENQISEFETTIYNSDIFGLLSKKLPKPTPLRPFDYLSEF